MFITQAAAYTAKRHALKQDGQKNQFKQTSTCEISLAALKEICLINDT